MRIILNTLTGLPNITSTRWGEIKGNIEDQEDLINLINNNLVELKYDVNNNLIETRELITLANYQVVNLTKGS